jgi:diguanylate cyclase (GGDEF)-like protein
MAKTSSDKIPVILLFTDVGSTRVSLKKIFREDYYILEVDSPKELLDKLTNTKIEIIIIDDKLKIALSFLLKEIRKISNAIHLPILIISNNLKKSYLKELITAGATDFFREPFETEEILNLVKTATQTQIVQQKLGPIARSLSQNLPVLGGKKLSSSRISTYDLALREVHKALQNKQSISLLMIDIDHLEKVKERWGDDSLEELLEKIEKYFHSLIRIQDILIHASQERYVVILPKTSEAAANALSETIGESFKNIKFTLHKGIVKLPVSIAVVTLLGKEMQTTEAYQYLEKILSVGDSHLEKAKKIGKRIEPKFINKDIL